MVVLNFKESCHKNHILTLGTCNPIKDVEVVECETEDELIMKWQKLIIEEIRIAQREGEKTSRLTALYNRVNELEE